MTTFGEKLRALMAERRISQRKLARLVPCDDGHLSKIANDRKRPSPELAARLDELLNAGGTLAALRPERPASPARGRSMCVEHTTAGHRAPHVAMAGTAIGHLHGAVDAGGDNGTVDRRALLGLMAAATASALHDTEPLREVFETALAADTGDRDADAWDRIAHNYAREVGWSADTVLRPELAADFAELSRLLPTARGHIRTRLIHAAAHMAALMAITLTNAGEGRAARRWWRTAARAADQTGDHRLAALVRGRAAVFALYTDTPRLSVLETAEDAIAVGRGRQCTGVVSAYAAKAQALAELGRHGEAVAALADVRGVFEQLPDAVTRDRSSQWGWSDGRLNYVTSLIHTCAGNVELGHAAQDAALAVCPDRNWQARGQIEMHRAGVLMCAGDVDEGARHMTRVLESLPVEQRRDGLVRGSALTSLRLVDPVHSARASVRQARELLILTGGR